MNKCKIKTFFNPRVIFNVSSIPCIKLVFLNDGLSFCTTIRFLGPFNIRGHRYILIQPQNEKYLKPNNNHGIQAP